MGNRDTSGNHNAIYVTFSYYILIPLENNTYCIELFNIIIYLTVTGAMPLITAANGPLPNYLDKPYIFSSNFNQIQMSNESKMPVNLNYLFVFLFTISICLQFLFYSVKSRYWMPCFLLERISTRWLFLLICWWFANLCLVNIRNRKKSLGSRADHDRRQTRVFTVTSLKYSFESHTWATVVPLDFTVMFLNCSSSA